jgi:hypothetical protein
MYYPSHRHTTAHTHTLTPSPHVIFLSKKRVIITFPLHSHFMAAHSTKIHQKFIKHDSTGFTSDSNE